MQAFAAPEDQVKPIYVDPENGDDNNNGTEWGKAMKTISAAVAKADTADYYNDRRVQVTLAKGTYVLNSQIKLGTRASLVGDPDCDRSEVVLTAPENTAMSGMIALPSEPDGDFVNTVANLTISNVMINTGSAAIDCAGTSQDRWSQVVSNVVVTHCGQPSHTWALSATGVSAKGRALVVDCLFSNLELGNYSLVGWCRGGGRFRNCRIENCTYASFGLIYNEGPTIADNVVEGCAFTNNTSETDIAGGGCVQNMAVVRDCLFVDNFAKTGNPAGYWKTLSDGYFNDNPPVVADCTFLRNVSSNGYGGVWFYNCGGTVTNCTFAGNVGRAGIVRDASAVVDCTFEDNSSAGVENSNGAGALYLTRGRPRVSGCRFVGNSVDDVSRGGGAIRGQGCPMDVANCTFEGNYGKLGGAVSAYANTTISNCVFSGNHADSGGGIFFEGMGEGTLVADCVFTNNIAYASGNVSGGAGISARAWQSTEKLLLTVRNCLFVDNALTNETGSASGSAAFLVSQGSTSAYIRVESCTMVGNRSARGAPALCVEAGAPGTLVTNCVLACNYGVDGAYAPGISDPVTADMAARVGHSYLHPKKGRADWWTGQNVICTDDPPAFKEGTWIPARKSALRDAGTFLSWMDGAFDLQRNAAGRPFVSRVYGGQPDIGAFEYAPSGGFTVIVR